MGDGESEGTEDDAVDVGDGLWTLAGEGEDGERTWRSGRAEGWLRGAPAAVMEKEYGKQEGK